MTENFTIDPEFRDKIPPLTEEEFTLLEENILSDGAVLSPLIVWEGIILDGHNRYEIIQNHPELPYTVHGMQFANRYEALSWICRNQLGRRNLTPQQKKYLIGQRYEAEKKAHGANDGFRGNQHSNLVSDQIGHLPDAKKTRRQIAEDTHTSEGYVQRANYYAKGVDAAEEALPGIKQDILTGVIKPTETAVAAIAKAEPEERQKLAEALKAEKSRPKKDDKPQPVYHKPTQPGSRWETLRQIEEISAEMEREKERTNEDSMLYSLDAETDSFMGLFDHIFTEYPRLLSDSGYREKLIQILQKLKQYILTIEGGRTK